MSELDPNQIISNVISNKIDETIGAIKDAFGGALDKAKAKLNIGYSDYIKRNYARCAQIKTILYRHQPVLLKKHYISPCLQVGKKKCEESAIFEKLGAGTRVVVIGTAGSGKSLFMKNAYIEFVNSGKRFVPIFIELRGLNEDGAKLLKHHILAEIQVIAQAVTEEFFDLGLKNGSFAFFLDGFDEIDYRKNKRVEKEILALTNSFPKCAFIISSRPDDRFFSWQEFMVYKILPMTQTQVVSLISKIEYEEVVKTKFISKIKSDLYKSHEEFLSNPLLATIMLLTFEQIADIPEKMHIFYQQAFETLFHRHDATKEMYKMYKRERFTEFPVDEFRRYLGAFCLVTYLDQRFSFDESAALGFLEEAFQLEGKKVADARKREFLQDLLMSVCMLQRDGTEIQFSHRSFQEYFCASYICSCDPTSVGKLLDEIVSRVFYDRTLSLIRDMNPEIFDRYWTVPRLAQIMTKLESLEVDLNPKEYIKVFCDQLVIMKQPQVIHFQAKGKIGRNWMLINFIYSGQWFGAGAYEEKMAIVEKFLVPPPRDAPRMRYMLEDLKEDAVRELLKVEGKMDDKKKLTDLYRSLRDRYARKDEQMSKLIAKARR